MSYTRFAIYYLPPAGPLADFGAAWLGWDVTRGCEMPGPDLPGLQDITMTPRKYGFHGTLKPPFRLADGCTLADLKKAVSELASALAPAQCDGLRVTPLGRFLALTIRGDTESLRRVAKACVRDLDGFRAPMSEAELARRRKPGLSARQTALLAEWGYPYVMEEFRFHMTLTGRMPKSDIPVWMGILQSQLPDLPEPFVVDQIALCGEREDRRFELIHRHMLTG
ncbi:putative xylose isomerase [Rhodobacteraceae bacterium KLH11]|nr:putative xylose isomerase [Rhodobacteraceae bacterium KLH11]